MHIHSQSYNIPREPPLRHNLCSSPHTPSWRWEDAAAKVLEARPGAIKHGELAHDAAAMDCVRTALTIGNVPMPPG